MTIRTAAKLPQEAQDHEPLEPDTDDVDEAGDAESKGVLTEAEV